MIFNRQWEKNAVPAKENVFEKRTKVMVWIEIPAFNFKRAVTFYEKLLKIKLDIKSLYDRPTALFSEEETGIKGSIVQCSEVKSGNGIKPVFLVPIMHEAIATTKYYGGEVVQEPTILRQKNEKGDVIIGTNLIDNKIGYITQIKDSEGNYLYLYSHS